MEYPSGLVIGMICLGRMLLVARIRLFSFSFLSTSHMFVLIIEYNIPLKIPHWKQYTAKRVRRNSVYIGP